MLGQAIVTGGIVAGEMLEQIVDGERVGFAAASRRGRVVRRTFALDGETIFHPVPPWVSMIAQRRVLFPSRIGAQLTGDELAATVARVIRLEGQARESEALQAAGFVVATWGLSPAAASFEAAAGALFWVVSALCYRPLLVGDPVELRAALRLLQRAATLIDAEGDAVFPAEFAQLPRVVYRGDPAALGGMPRRFWRETVPDVQALLLRFRLGLWDDGDRIDRVGGSWPGGELW